MGFVCHKYEMDDVTCTINKLEVNVNFTLTGLFFGMGRLGGEGLSGPSDPSLSKSSIKKLRS